MQYALFFSSEQLVPQYKENDRIFILGGNISLKEMMWWKMAQELGFPSDMLQRDAR